MIFDKKKYRNSGYMQDPRGGKVASMHFKLLFFFGVRIFQHFLGEVVFIFSVWSSSFFVGGLKKIFVNFFSLRNTMEWREN